MTAIHAPRVARPTPYRNAEGDVAESAAKRAQPSIDPRRRPELDRLVVGAPLTAAAVGLLLAEGARSSGTAEGQAGAEPVTTPVRADAGGADPAASPARASGSGSEGFAAGEAVGDATASASGVSLGSSALASEQGSMAVSDAGATTLEGPGAVSTSAAAKAAVQTGPTVSISFAGMPAGDGWTAGETESGAGEAERGDIGRFVQAGDGGEVIHGTPADDILRGGAGDDEIHGHAGNDLIDGGAGDDLLFGGLGEDRLIGGRGEDELHGGAGNDDLAGGSGDDRLFGESGDDILSGGAGSDLLDGGSGADRMAGGSGDDELVFADVHDVALENQRSADQGGVDTVTVDAGLSQNLSATFGLDEATFLLDPDVDQTPPGSTTPFQQQLDPDVENVQLQGTADHDVVGNDADNRIVGNSGDNVLHGRGGDDILSGGGGADMLIGGAGDDLLRGGSGDDILRGSSGDDDLYGGAGDDLLDGGVGTDRLFGEAGNDTFVLGLHEDTVDTVFDDEGSNSIVIDGAAGHVVETALIDGNLFIIVDSNTIGVVDQYDGASFASIDTGAGGVAIADLMAENAVGGSLGGAGTWAEPAVSDVLAEYLDATSHFGSGLADHLEGTSAPDWLSGADGDDVLSGSAGHDILEGGHGSDLLEGGAGDDVYLFTSGESGVDVIRDAQGADSAQLEGFAGARIEGVRVGQDLWIVADNAPIFRVEQIDESGFTGVRNGDEFVSVDDLLA